MDMNTFHSNIQQIAKSYGLDQFACEVEYLAPESQMLHTFGGGALADNPIYIDSGRRFIVITWTCRMLIAAKSDNELNSLNMIKAMTILNDDTIQFSGDFKISISIEGDGALKSRIIENIRKIAMQIKGTHMPVIPWPDTTPEKYNKYYDNYPATYKLPAEIAQDLKSVHGIDVAAAIKNIIPQPYSDTSSTPSPMLSPKVMKDISNAIDDELRDEFDPPPLPKPQRRRIKLD